MHVIHWSPRAIVAIEGEDAATGTVDIGSIELPDDIESRSLWGATLGDYLHPEPTGVMADPAARREVLQIVAAAVAEEALKTKYWRILANHWERKFSKVVGPN